MADQCRVLSLRQSSDASCPAQNNNKTVEEPAAPTQTDEKVADTQDAGDHHDGLTGCQLLRQVRRPRAPLGFSAIRARCRETESGPCLTSKPFVVERRRK